MIREEALRRSTDRLTTYIEKYVTLAGPEKKEEVLQLFDKILQVFPHLMIMTCPVMHPDIRYISKNCAFIFGRSWEWLDNNMTAERYFSFVYEADQDDLHECFSFMHDYLEAVPAEEHQSYRSVFHYRLKKSNGQYVYLRDDKASVNLNGSGNLYYAVLHDLTSAHAFTGVKVEIFKQEQSLNKIREYKPQAKRTSLSKRETELVNLIKQGLSTKEIAWYLNISQNTVRNIKSKLFEKYNVNNAIELLNMTG